MALDRNLDGARQVAGVVVAHGVDEVADQAQVAAAVTVAHIGLDLFDLGIPYPLFPLRKSVTVKALMSPSISPRVAMIRVRRPPLAMKASIEKLAVTPFWNSILVT